MSRKPKNNVIKGFLATRPVAQHGDDSFNDDITNHTLIKNFLRSSARPRAESPDTSFANKSLNKSLLSPEKTPRRILKKLLKGTELPQGSPVRPATPSPSPRKPVTRSSIVGKNLVHIVQTTSSSPKNKSPQKSSLTTPRKPSLSTPRKSPRLSKQTGTPLPGSSQNPEEQLIDESTVDSGSPNLDSQEDPDATVDSGAPRSETVTTTTSSSSHKQRSTPSRSSIAVTPRFTRSQSRNVSFVSPGPPDTPSPVVHKAGPRKERPRRRGRRNSNILDTTSDKSASQETVSDEEDYGNLSPSFDSPPPSPVASTTMSPYSRRAMAQNKEDVPSKPASPLSPSFDDPPTTTTTRTTTWNPNDTSMPLPSPPTKWSARKRQRGIKQPSSPTSPTASSPSSPSTPPTPSTPSAPSASSAPSAPSTPPTPPESSPPSPPRSNSAAIQIAKPTSTARKPRPSLTHAKSTSPPHVTSADQNDTSLPLPSPPTKWSARKRQRGAKQDDAVLPSSSSSTLPSPDKLRADSSRGPSPKSSLIRSEKRKKSPIENPVLYDPDVSVPYDTPPTKWESRRGTRKGRVSLPDSPFVSGEPEEESEEEDEEGGHEEGHEEVEKSTSPTPRSPSPTPIVPSPTLSASPAPRVPSPTPSAPLEVTLEADVPDEVVYEHPRSSHPSVASSSSQVPRLFSASGNTPKLRSPQYDYADRGLFTDSPFPQTRATAEQNMAAYKAALGKAPISMPAPPRLHMTGGPKARQQMEKKKQLAEQKKAVKKRKRVQSDVSDSDEDEDDLRFPKSTTEEVYYDFAKKKISKDAMAVVHKGVNNFWLSFCKNIEEIRLKEGKGKRKKIILSDMKLLAEKMRFTNEMVDFNSLLREMLPKELQECLIPIARAGNVVGVKRI